MATTAKSRKKSQEAWESSGAAAAEPPEETIARRAYEIYVARGASDGNDLDDWLQAERELRTGQGEEE